MTALVAQYNQQQAQEHVGQNEFITPKELVDTHEVFSVIAIRQQDFKVKTAKYGRKIGQTLQKWALDIELSDGEQRTLTFDVGGSRDELFTLMQSDLPQHNCFLEEKQLRNGNRFYNFCQNSEDPS